MIQTSLLFIVNTYIFLIFLVLLTVVIIAVCIRHIGKYSYIQYQIQVCACCYLIYIHYKIICIILFLLHVIEGMCGSTETDAEGSLTLPASFPPNTTCKWIFPLSNFSKVYLMWNQLNLNSGEYLAFYNGSEGDGKLITNITGTTGMFIFAFCNNNNNNNNNNLYL